MWPRYPSVASRAGRYANTRTTARGSNRALVATYGPSPTAASTMAPPASARPDADSISVLHGMVAEAAASRWGNADPTVSAPMRMPSAAPRWRSNQPAATFMPGGYTQASAAPVAMRSAMRTAGSPARTSPAFAAAPATQPRANSHRGLMMSGRLSAAERSVPATKPPWTAIVSHAVAAGVRWNFATIDAVAAVAENHSVMTMN